MTSVTAIPLGLAIVAGLIIAKHVKSLAVRIVLWLLLVGVTFPYWAYLFGVFM